MKKSIALLFFLSLTVACFSQVLSKKQEKKVEKLFKHRTELYFTFEIKDRSEITTLTRIISIDNVKNTTVWAYANKEEFKKFLLYNYKYKVLTNPSQIQKVKTKKLDTGKQMSLISSYPTYTSYEALMTQYATNYPAICKLVTIGTLPSGRKLLMLKITDNINARENEPQFLYTSSMHGDETAGYIGMLNLIDYLLSNYGTNTRVTNLVNNIEIWINPLANPDGTYAGGNNTVNGATRYNANMVDLNRNYPDPQAGQHPDGNSWQPETQYFMSFADTMDFVMAGNFHGGAEVVNYPWDTWATAHADNNWWIRESQKYADTVFANSSAGYFTSVTPTGITNGFAWYQITGGRQDYMNYYEHCREFTLEISDTKLLPTTEFTNNWNYNYKSYLNYMEESLYGIRGIIRDACTNLPIKAKIFISGHDIDSSHVYSSIPVGNYHRPVYQGNYNVTYSAPGYISKTISGINVSNGAATIVDVSLNPTVPVADFSISNSNACNGTVSFNDQSGSANFWHWNFGDGTNSSSQNPTHTYLTSGTYNVSLVVGNCAGTDSIYKNNVITVNVTSLPIVSGDSASTCGPQALSLQATGTGTLNWYDAPTGGALVNTGTTFNTPVLSNTTTYYVENVLSGGSQYVGALNNSIGTGGYFTGSTYHYLKFTSNNPFQLISVWVNANTSGNRTIELRNSAGVVLQSSTINIPAGQSRVTLNFNVPAGTDLQLGVAGNNNLFRNQTGGNYPYTITNTVTITGNSANILTYYYYFYDWEILQSCASSRIPVTGIINPTSPVSVSILSNDIEICQGETISFTSQSINPGTMPAYQWLVNGDTLGTGNTFSSSSLMNGDIVSCILASSNSCSSNNPATSNSISVTVHSLPPTPSITQTGIQLNSSSISGNQWYGNNNGIIAGETGNTFSPATSDGYYVIVTDNFGCMSDTSNIIQFSTTGISSLLNNQNINIYPNPSNEAFTVDFGDRTDDRLIELYNLVGQKIFSLRSYTKSEQVNCSEIPEGIYLIKITVADEMIVKKLTIKHKQ
ncbi:MAG: PKD domain-containing protein [Bacteroidia bacterium]|nr:PKD domain-containing protein [Bacteroidia bacterium]